MFIYLYVKQHKITGLKYFGRTIKNPFKYKGSGTHWNRHLKKHGFDIETIEVYGFDDQETCTKFAIKFSNENMIVESKLWANEVPENGVAGGGATYWKNKVFTEEHKAKLSKAHQNKIMTEEHKKNMSIAHTGRVFSEETKQKLSIKAKNRKVHSMTGRKHSKETLLKMQMTRQRNKALKLSYSL